MKFYQLLTEASQYIIPQLYKQRFFKKQNQLSRENIISRKVEPELLWLTEFLPKDAVFIDVGANVGHFIYQLEYHLFPQNIYAFEPNKSELTALAIDFFGIFTSSEIKNLTNTPYFPSLS